jgi:uncharacterized membrane protein YtjA (UPF0391 family)
MYLKI